MSGGSWDYVYRQFESVAERLRFEKQPERRALGALILKVAKALHDIEWVDSCDYGPGDERKAIDALVPRTAVLSELIQEAREAQAALTAEIERAETQNMAGTQVDGETKAKR